MMRVQILRMVQHDLMGTKELSQQQVALLHTACKVRQYTTASALHVQVYI